ncbi:hypothetical protein Mame01_38040 [Microbispora amethystogenes]|nr:hypothetical protein Mame01_38040 [Microbispora amethystogenes]
MTGTIHTDHRAINDTQYIEVFESHDLTLRTADLQRGNYPVHRRLPEVNGAVGARWRAGELNLVGPPEGHDATLLRVERQSLSNAEGRFRSSEPASQLVLHGRGGGI